MSAAAARIALLTLAVVGALAPAAAAQLSTLESRDLRLVYIAPSEEYLAPYAVRAFEDAQHFLAALFDYKPDEKITVLLADFSDYGNASAGTVPHDALRIHIAPLSFAFETIAGNERINIIMNHELVQRGCDGSGGQEGPVFRASSAARCQQSRPIPNRFSISFSRPPRGRTAVVPRRDLRRSSRPGMAGGLGRAQGAYDEMVFRSMVRDSARFYDPLGLVSEGTKVDFQLRDQLVSVRHAIHDVARQGTDRRKWSRGWRGAMAVEATMPASSATCSARPSNTSGADGPPTSSTSSRRNLEPCAAIR